jgi:4-hydroxy-tetrahydrodipicolinate reductase
VGRLLERIRIGIVGLGWVGQEVARAALEDPRVRLVGVVDVDPTKAGRDLGEIIGEGRLGIPIDADVETMLSRARPEVAVLCTTSDVEQLGPTLEICVKKGAHVVATCENLADPDTALTQLEPGFDRRVREANVVVLATGVNPGFAMDRLPVMLTQATRNIRRVRVVRVVNASTRRAQLQAKIGVGMTPHQFSESIQRGEVGHAGLSSSLRLLAKGLGIVLEKTSEAFTPIIAEQATSSSILGPVKAGAVRGIYQIARGYRARREVITLELTMALDEPNPRDTIDIVGEPPLHFEGELPGDSCTIATVLSAISVIVTMPAGLRTVLDLPLEQPEEPLGAPKEEPVPSTRPRAQTELPHPAPAAKAPRAAKGKKEPVKPAKAPKAAKIAKAPKTEKTEEIQVPTAFAKAPKNGVPKNGAAAKKSSAKKTSKKSAKKARARV